MLIHIKIDHLKTNTAYGISASHEAAIVRDSLSYRNMIQLPNRSRCIWDNHFYMDSVPHFEELFSIQWLWRPTSAPAAFGRVSNQPLVSHFPAQGNSRSKTETVTVSRALFPGETIMSKDNLRTELEILEAMKKQMSVHNWYTSALEMA